MPHCGQNLKESMESVDAALVQQGCTYSSPIAAFWARTGKAQEKACSLESLGFKCSEEWSGRLDLNQRPLDPQSSTLPTAPRPGQIQTADVWTQGETNRPLSTQPSSPTLADGIHTPPPAFPFSQLDGKVNTKRDECR